MKRDGRLLIAFIFSPPETPPHYPPQSTKTMSEWTADANTALNLVLVRSPDDLLPDETDKEVVFHPSFTYPVGLIRLAGSWWPDAVFW